VTVTLTGGAKLTGRMSRVHDKGLENHKAGRDDNGLLELRNGNALNVIAISAIECISIDTEDVSAHRTP
jgi:hypothetical protein